MKTMTEIVESIKNQELKLPQKVAGLLALVMLTTMLASCDEFDKPGHGRPHGTKEPTIEDTVDPEIPTYEHLEIEEFTGEALDPMDCGLSVIKDFGLQSIFDMGADVNYIDRKYKGYLESKDDVKFNDEIETCFAIKSLINDNGTVKNVEFTVSSKRIQREGWTHKIVLTENDFALVSIAPSGETFITGFNNGTFQNQAGFIDNDTIKLSLSMYSQAKYSEILNYAKKSFVNKLMLLSESNKLTIACGIDNFLDTDNFKEYNVVMSGVVINNENLKAIGAMSVSYNVSHDYIDKIIENESINTDYVTSEETVWEPITDPHNNEVVTLDPSLVPPQYDEDYTGDDGLFDEGETTGASTEAEIEPDVTLDAP
jgi:hypothetical protein